MGQLIQGVFCLFLAVILLAGGSALWLTIRGRPVTLENIGMQIGGIVKWMVADLIINLIFSSIFGNNNRRRW